MGPGVAGECLEKADMHVNEDHFLIEIVDPATSEPLADGEEGELVITTLAELSHDPVPYRRHHPYHPRALPVRPHQLRRIGAFSGAATTC